MAKRQRLIQRRRALGLTQEALAELVAVGRSTVVRWERGESEPQPSIRPRLARALKVSEELLESMLTVGDQRTAVAPPRQLLAAVADFTGRAAELRRLTQILDGAAAGRPGTVVISAIGGMAGVGKSALALHWAHQVAGRFPGGQLYVNLRGFDPSGTPVTTTEAIRGFLYALGVPPERVPANPEAQAGLYRSLLAGRRMLIVLDNARDEQQVRPLLPASAGTLVLVTSRSKLAGLAAADGARLLSLDVLAHGEATDLLAARIGADRAAAEPGAVSEIASLCACLPLAVGIAAARAAIQPSLPLAALADELRDSAGRLDALDAGDPGASVRAVFSWSVCRLSRDGARMFRLLGIHAGPDISVPAAASLAGRDQAQARRELGELARAHLITERLPGRYAFHDLLRAYAAEQARDAGSEQERDAAIGRMLDHYLHSGVYAARVLNPSHEPVDVAPPGPDVTPERPADHRRALAWFEEEHQVLLAAITLAVQSGFDVRAWQLPWALTPFMQARGDWQEWVAIQRTALAAAARLGDLAAQAVCSRLLAVARSELGDYDESSRLFAASLTLYQRLGNRLGEAKVQFNLAALAEGQGRYPDMLVHSEQALRLYQAIGDKASEATALNNIGWTHCLLGDYMQARAFCRQALDLCAEVGHPWLEGYVWDSLGYAEHHMGNLGEAAACYEHALSLHKETGDRICEADTLTHLGETCQAAGQLSQARQAWKQALAIFDDLRNRDGAEKLRGMLASADGHGPSDLPLNATGRGRFPSASATACRGLSRIRCRRAVLTACGEAGCRGQLAGGQAAGRQPASRSPRPTAAPRSRGLAVVCCIALPRLGCERSLTPRSVSDCHRPPRLSASKRLCSRKTRPPMCHFCRINPAEPHRWPCGAGHARRRAPNISPRRGLFSSEASLRRAPTSKPEASEVNDVTNDSVILFVAAAAVRLAWWAVARCSEMVQHFIHGLALAALARVAGPGATVIERHADGTVLAVAIAEKERG